ncbi:MAG: Thiamin-phosphate pyrophosphorylase [Myxococcaceae bacterium]|nr:Thiamin-phosphate pyrophosphorylase [Myxococcaceae bacterium]
MRGLYAILDTEALASREMPPLAFAEAVLAARPAALQLRAKNASARDVLALLGQLAPLCKQAGVPLVCNDRPDLAVLAGADLVHLGQDDAPIDLVRGLFPTLRIGLSTHTRAQLEQALAAKPAYVAYGPVFATTSKKDHAAVVGLEGLRVAAGLARRAGVPLVAIGGITQARAHEVALHADAVAVIGALVEGDVREVRSRASQLQTVFSGGHVSEPATNERVATS